MKTALAVVASLVGVWAVGTIVFRIRERRLRKPVAAKLKGPPANKLDLPAVDLAEHQQDRVCLVYWNDRAMAWQFPRRKEDIRTIPFANIRGWGLDANLHILLIETEKRGYGWQFRRTRRVAVLLSQLAWAIKAGAPHDVATGQEVGDRIQHQLGPLMREKSIPLDDPRAADVLASLPREDLPLVVPAQVEARPPPPLSSWTACPDCGGALVFLPDRRAADCAGCRLVWCDPNLGPLTVEIGPDEGKLVGTESRPALMSYEIQAGEHEKVRGFIRRPRPSETPFPLP